MKHPIPDEIRLLRGRTGLGLIYGGEIRELPAEYLRVYSPSAQVRGHAPGQAVLQTGKQGITIADLEHVGLYALKITFSDGHDSGLYDWDYLYTLAFQHEALWADYLQRLEQAGASRAPVPQQEIPAAEKNCGGCGKH
ncbi:MAG: DUF971 domain-containing protein [Neisseria sp.]|nr:DUF971 domain-containing protein [Neisseria sp.]